MKINKIIIRVSHFFGFMRDSFHIDDVKMNIPSIYNEKDFDNDDPIVINDIKDQVNRKFKEDKKFEKVCRKANQVWVVLPTNETKRLLYKEGSLFYPCDTDNLIWKRNEEINKALN